MDRITVDVERSGGGGCEGFWVSYDGVHIALFVCAADANIYAMMLVGNGMANSAHLADGTHIRP